MNSEKNPQHDFPKMRGGGGGGSKAVWNFSENSSVLERGSFPKTIQDFHAYIYGPWAIQDFHVSIVLPKGHIDYICPLGHIGYSCITFLGPYRIFMHHVP